MMTRGRFLKTTMCGAAVAAAQAQGASRSADIVVYVGSPAGLASAQAVVRRGGTAMIVEPTVHIGWLVTGGIACTDTGTPHFVGGLSAEFFDAVAAEKRLAFPAPAQPKILFRGQSIPWREVRLWDLEPKVARRVIEGWAAKPGQSLTAVRVQAGWRFGHCLQRCL